MIAPSTIGLRCCHSMSPFVTEMKSEPRNTPSTPSMEKRRVASGDAVASVLVRKSAVPSARTPLPGMNFNVAGLGVASVWMNMASRFDLGSLQLSDHKGRQAMDGVRTLLI